MRKEKIVNMAFYYLFQSTMDEIKIANKCGIQQLRFSLISTLSKP
ncbi:unnamed protein product [Paramecium octaurelia]|uniref:Uncharacterized protein n=1 Tax=Paramecium octaurelia TaxID=43137 RepID=A0A8S1WYR7_PAROT|nr:unnamed protein product [Paramecium octaurelia]